MASVVVNAVNEEFKGWIAVYVDTNLDSQSGINEITIHRRIEPDGDYKQIGKVNINRTGEVNFIVYDITARAGVTYGYVVNLKSNGTVITYASSHNIICNFDGLFIGNLEKQYFARANCKTDTNRNTEVSYVTTLGSKYPFKISNATVNYNSGSSSGLFFELSNDNRLLPDYYHKYSNPVIDFLSDGTDKILRTADGQAWCISVDNAINLPFNDYYDGMNLVEFNWTEVDDVSDYISVIDMITLDDTLPEFAFNDNGNIVYRYNFTQSNHAFRIDDNGNLQADGLSTTINSNGYIELA